MSGPARRRPLVLWPVVAVLALTGAAAVQERAGRFDERLEALDPARPRAYFELAEEVADAASTEAERHLAERLFALAGVLDPGRLGRSACLGLADLARQEQTRRRLLALAWLLDGREGGLKRPPGAGSAEVSPAAALAVAEAFSHYRKGHGGRALAALDQPGAMELLQRYGDALRGGAARFLADCRLYQGPQQQPTVAPVDLAAMLRLEVALLAGEDRSWSQQLLLAGGRPLIEVDPEHLAETLGVDAGRPYYRNGVWVGQ